MQADQELLEESKTEALEHLDRIEPKLLEIERDTSRASAHINDIFRGIHTIKGVFSFFGLTTIIELSHTMENLLSLIRENKIQVNLDIATALLNGLDKIRILLSDLNRCKDISIDDEVNDLLPFINNDSSMAKIVKRKKLHNRDGAKNSLHSQSESETLRVKVNLLNKLMNSAGELVLNRNQLIRYFYNSKSKFIEDKNTYSPFKDLETELKRITHQYINNINSNRDDLKQELNKYINESKVNILEKFKKPLSTHNNLNSMVQNLDRNTSSLQDHILETRMQPISILFNKFQRITRDLTKDYSDKNIELILEDNNVELDKNILEELTDSLFELVKNSVSHGIESSTERRKKAKSPFGYIKLTATRSEGKVQIVIMDNGRGIINSDLDSFIKSKNKEHKSVDTLSKHEISNFILHPEFNKEHINDNAKGGFQLVKSGLEKLGGTIEIDNNENEYFKVILKLPITLAIIPCLIVNAHNHIFSIPQSQIKELVRIKHDDLGNKIEKIHNHEVLRLREELLPLVNLSDILQIDPMYRTSEGQYRIDRRKRLSDRRKKDQNHNTSYLSPQLSIAKRKHDTRRTSIQNSITIVVVQYLEFKIGLLVHEILDNEEIVIKSLSKYIYDIPCFAGSTILGSGAVSMVLDINGLGKMCNFNFSILSMEKLKLLEKENSEEVQEDQDFLLFNIGTNDTFALPLDLIGRIETVPKEKIQIMADKLFINYESYSIEIMQLGSFLNLDGNEELPDEIVIIIPKLVKHPFGIICHKIIDTLTTRQTLSKEHIDINGILGSFLLNKELVMMLDVYKIMEVYDPERYKEVKCSKKLEGKKVLLAEDSKFFQKIIIKFLEEIGIDADLATDGEKAWEQLCDSGKKYDCLITDIQMPNLDGFGLVKRVRKHEHFKDIPIMALSSMSTKRYIEKGMEAGVDKYEIKFDKERQKMALEDLLVKDK